jgi:hypothetical protein
MGILHRLLLTVLSVLGSGLIVYSTIGDVILGYRMLLLAIGLAIVLMGTWRLFDPILPEERHDLLLRTEADHCLGLVRQLNTAASVVQEFPTPEIRQVAEDAVQAMYKAVEQMVVVSGIPYSVASTMPRHESQQPYAEESKTASMNSI